MYHLTTLINYLAQTVKVQYWGPKLAQVITNKQVRNGLNYCCQNCRRALGSPNESTSLNKGWLVDWRLSALTAHLDHIVKLVGWLLRTRIIPEQGYHKANQDDTHVGQHRDVTLTITLQSNLSLIGCCLPDVTCQSSLERQSSPILKIQRAYQNVSSSTIGA